MNIHFKYFYAQLTRDEGHHVDDVTMHASPNWLCSSSYEVNSEAYGTKYSITSICGK